MGAAATFHVGESGKSDDVVLAEEVDLAVVVAVVEIGREPTTLSGIGAGL